MSSSRNSARQTLAELFDVLQPQKAHWYSIISPRSEDPSGERIKVLFPPIATLLSMREDIFEFVLMKCGLMRNIKNKSSPSMNSWEDFRSEFQLHIEFTIFSISGKRYNFIRIGSWGLKNPAATPKEIWSARDYSVPKLRVATISMNFSSKIGSFYECNNAPVREAEDSSDSSEDEAESTESEEAKAEEVVLSANIFPTIELSQEDFPLLHSLGINQTYQIDTLIQELLKLKGANGVIEFKQRNNRSGFLLQVPSVRCTSRYRLELSRQSSFTSAAINVISRSAQCTEGEAAECLLEAIFKRYEEAFMSVAKNNGIVVPAGKKMDALQVEAMLSECRLGKESSRILFRHLKQFLGKNHFESEHKRRSFFSGKDFPTTVDKLELADKTVIDFWFKEPDKLIENQINVMITESQLEGLKRVDLCVGGDHGGGKFRMSLKVLFRFEAKETISHLYQIASVSHSADDSKILKDTVLTPIGSSLRDIAEGGRFIVQRDDTTNRLVARFKITVNIFVLLMQLINHQLISNLLNIFLWFSFPGHLK